jgi:ABC-type maltose transport system permease subunit
MSWTKNFLRRRGWERYEELKGEFGVYSYERAKRNLVFLFFLSLGGLLLCSSLFLVDLWKNERLNVGFSVAWHNVDLSVNMMSAYGVGLDEIGDVGVDMDSGVFVDQSLKEYYVASMAKLQMLWISKFLVVCELGFLFGGLIFCSVLCGYASARFKFLVKKKGEIGDYL